MKGIFIIAILFGVYTPLFSQWSDDFSDNEFTSNPAWFGKTTDFIVDGEILRLNAPAVTSTSYLSTNSDISLEATWNFYVKLDFNPSSSNYIKVYLMADSLNLENTQNGYFVKIGGTLDEVSLYKVAAGLETVLIDGDDDRVDLGVVEINITVTRLANGDWELKSKLLGETSFVSEEIMNDLAVQQSTYFGVFCKYTSTRSTKFYVDDISVLGNPYIDNYPPKLASSFTPENRQIGLVFNEAMDTLEAKNLGHYTLNNTISAVNVTVIKPDSLLLKFNSDLALINTLEIELLPDLVGNTLDTLVQIVFVNPVPHIYRDVVINEIFPDPNPQEDLPAFEFIELLNISNKIIDLEGWQFTDGSKIATLESALIHPDSFLIICPKEAQNEYAILGETMGIANWPTLNNGGDSLKITNKLGVVIDSVSYLQSWYNDTAKDDGGFSLEQINPLSVCLGEFNWAASASNLGGSPGKTNTLYTINTDFEAPIITQALVTDSLVELWFSEPIVPHNYVGLIEPGELNPIFNVVNPAKFSSAYLLTKLSADKSYTIKIALEDCKGNGGMANANLILIAHPKKGDLLINELLFNPYTGGADFVELANATNNFFNLKGFSITNGETAGSIITDTTLIIAPNHYLAISENVLFLKNQYLAPDSSLFEADLPTMPNDEGIVVLKSNLGETVDSVFYSEDYHFSLISDVEGISLERISLTESSGNKDNWRSAAETIGFATPGYENSQSSTSSKTDKIVVTPKIITPNNDGQADYCQISFALEQKAQTISISVYTINGYLVYNVANNALISPNGFFTWDGTDQQGGILPTAHYIIVSEVVFSDGQTNIFRNKVVVANGF